MTLAPPGPRYTDQALLQVFLRNDLYAFVQKTFETVNPGARFSRNWSTEAVTYALQKVADGTTTRLIINIPPRHLKSICASVALPAFLLGRDPTRKVISVSYSDELASKFSNDCRAVMRSDWYQKIFPRCRIDRAKDTEAEVRTTERGYRLATSVGGTLTGRGGDVIIIDDPIKPQDAQSKVVREKCIQWYENTLLSRLDDKVHGAIVLVMQRLHLDDLAGHLLERGGFEHLCLSAIAEKRETIRLDRGHVHVRQAGDVLDPIREPLSALERQRAAMTPLVFSAQFQQSPIPLEGNLIKRDWIRYFGDDLPRQEGDYFVISWDTALKASELADYSVGTVWQVRGRGNEIYLVDLVRGRLEYPELVAAATDLWRKWKFEGRATHLVIEDKGSGSSLIQSLKHEKIFAHLHHAKLEGDKVMRLTAQAAYFHAGRIYFKKDAPWLDELMAELLGFPGVKHDDQVDSVSQALAFLGWRESQFVSVGPLPF
ncbi:MAG TPA: phage terminase large subunit [Nitrospira sp.]|jgi:predicted phage terminase large subunit-like protein